jgi:hypothetical protein
MHACLPIRHGYVFLALGRDIFGSSQISDKKIMAYAWPTNCYGRKKYGSGMSITLVGLGWIRFISGGRIGSPMHAQV